MSARSRNHESTFWDNAIHYPGLIAKLSSCTKGLLSRLELSEGTTDALLLILRFFGVEMMKTQPLRPGIEHLHQTTARTFYHVNRPGLFADYLPQYVMGFLPEYPSVWW